MWLAWLLHKTPFFLPLPTLCKSQTFALKLQETKSTWDECLSNSHSPLLQSLGSSHKTKLRMLVKPGIYPFLLHL